MKKAIILMILLVLITACQRQIEIQNEEIPPVAEINEQGQVVCKDHFCFFDNFQKCNPAVFTLSIMDNGGKYKVSIESMENGKCRIKRSIDNKGIDCLYPMEALNSDTFEHLFAKDTQPGMEEKRRKQIELDKEFCKEF